MSKCIIGVDIDLTVAQIDDLWYDWLVRMTGYDPMIDVSYDMLEDSQHLLEYNLSTYWKEQLEERGIDGLEFFRGTHLYDMVDPVHESPKYINELYEEGYDIVFISALKGHHHRSKYEFLGRHFNFDGFIGTKEKQYINCDIMIDDRNNFLNLSRADVKIKIFTPYTQDVGLENDVKLCHNWEEIYNYIKELEL